MNIDAILFFVKNKLNFHDPLSFLRSSAGFFLILAYLFLPFSLAANNVGMVLSVLVGVISGLFLKNIKVLKKEPLIIFILSFFLMIVVASFYSLSSWDGALGVTFNKYSKILYGVIFICLLLEKKTRDLCFYAFALGCFFILLSTYLKIWFELPWATKKWNDGTIFGNYITQGIMMSFFTLQCLFWSSKQKEIKLKMLGWFVAALAAFSILYLLDGRTGYLTLTVGLLAYMGFALTKRWLVVGVVVLIFISSIAFLTSERVQGRFELAKEETILLFDQYQQGVEPALTSIGARWFMWIKSAELIAERPITGWGVGSHGIKWCEKAPQPHWCAIGDTTPHNQFLFFGVEMGIPGVACFLALLIILFKTALNAGQYKPMMMGFIAIFIADSMVNASLWNSREYNFFILMMCLLYSMARFEKREF